MTGRGRLAVVTAAASGIGLAIAEALAKAGWRVVIADIDAARGAAEAARLGAEFRACDMRDADQIAALFAGLGPVHVLVNNAGIAGPTLPVTDLPVEEWRAVLDINLTAQFIACQQVVAQMVAAGDGVIINMSSIAGRIGYPNRTPYAASKWGVLGFTRSLAQEVGRHGVRVNAILPGAVRGPRIEAVIEAYARANQVSLEAAEARYLDRQATGAFVEPDEIAALVVFLCGDEARSITAQCIGIDGGYE